MVGAPLAVLLLAQLVPVRRENPPVVHDAEAPPEVKAILRRACYDCHSNETVWGPHTSVAPISWLAAHDVSEGREELNFSRWGQERPGRVGRKLRHVLADGEMPPWIYVVGHPSARLSAADQAALSAWADTLAAQRGGEERGRRGR
ncbi:MAG: heme-binding domain-containing protein [Deltaproteobacteria bacterium]|nr:heme-binding domain-containing protein [Deltaproteobacteria bacterium]